MHTQISMTSHPKTPERSVRRLPRTPTCPAADTSPRRTDPSTTACTPGGRGAGGLSRLFSCPGRRHIARSRIRSRRWSPCPPGACCMEQKVDKSVEESEERRSEYREFRASMDTTNPIRVPGDNNSGTNVPSLNETLGGVIFERLQRLHLKLFGASGPKT